MGNRGPKPKGKVKIKWSANFAYAIGLLVTDGSLSKDGRHIDFTSAEMEQIKNYLRALNIKVKIGKKYSANKDVAFRIQFSDVPFYNFLQNIGLTPNKSLTMGEIDIKENLFFHFLRGCFDGDGSSYSYWDPRWKSSFMFYISFASGSLSFITWLQSMITKLSSLEGHLSVHKKKGMKNSYYQLRYSKYEAIRLVRHMYINKRGLKLKRKYLKIKKSLDIVQKHKGRVFVR